MKRELTVFWPGFDIAEEAEEEQSLPDVRPTAVTDQRIVVQPSRLGAAEKSPRRENSLVATSEPSWQLRQFHLAKCRVLCNAYIHTLSSTFLPFINRNQTIDRKRLEHKRHFIASRALSLV